MVNWFLDLAELDIGAYSTMKVQNCLTGCECGSIINIRRFPKRTVSPTYIMMISTYDNRTLYTHFIVSSSLID